MENSVFQSEIEQLQQQIELEETNYKKALENHKDFPTLKDIKERIKELKNTLQLTINKSNASQSGDLLEKGNTN